MLGGAFSWSNDRLGLNASMLYKYATEGSRDTDLGDVLAYNAAVAYGLSGGEDHHHDHGRHAAHNHSSLSLLLELNGEWRDKEEISGGRNPNSGGNVLYLSPGLRYGFAEILTPSLSIGVPIVTDLNGTQAEPDWRLIAGLSAAF